MKIKVEESEAGMRLDKLLPDRLKDKNRSQIKKLIDSGFVLVGDKPAKASYKVKEKDLIELRINPSTKLRTGKEELRIDGRLKNDDEKKTYSDILRRIKIIRETEEYLVVNKPAGLVVHGAPHIREYSLADWLLEKYPGLKGIGEDSDRPGIVHRLDKDASGLMVVARSQESYNNLKKQFQNRVVEKRYKALVFGQVIKDEDEINFLIKRSSAGNKQAAVPVNFEDDDSAREAVSFFKAERRFINYTLLDVRIKTGRKHQIRAHMHAYGHPVVGDILYSTKKTRELNKKLDLGRIFLVAYHLAFNDTTGERQEFEISLPKGLEDFLKKIK